MLKGREKNTAHANASAGAWVREVKKRRINMNSCPFLGISDSMAVETTSKTRFVLSVRDIALDQ